MILNERDNRHEEVLRIAQEMMVAARTAPKGKGVDIIEIAMVTESNIRILSDTMKQMYEENTRTTTGLRLRTLWLRNVCFTQRRCALCD